MIRNFRGLGLCALSLLSFASVAHAGTFYCTSISCTNYIPVGSYNSGHTTSSFDLSGGKTIGVELDITPKKVFTQAPNGNCMTGVAYVMNIEWRPDPMIPGDTIPATTFVPYFDVTSVGIMQLGGVISPTGGSYIDTSGTYYQDQSPNWASVIYDSGSGNVNFTTTNYSYPYPTSFIFGGPDANGYWHANATIEVSTWLYGNGVFFGSEVGGLKGKISQAMTLMKLGTYTVY